MNCDDEHWMRQALHWAENAALQSEVPVGAVVVKDGVIVGVGANATVGQNDPTAHAEVLALRDAAQRLGNYRLEGCTLYVTLEPCTMCSGALLHARVARVVYGAAEPKTGAAGSVFNVFDYGSINHQTEVTRGVLNEECAAVLARFFQQRRSEQKLQAKANWPLADTALRNPDQAFDDISDWPYIPRWCNDLPGAVGLRLAYVDTGDGVDDGGVTWLCVHGAASWGYVFRHLVGHLERNGQRVVVPDLPGFGRSDQPKREKQHSAEWYLQLLHGLIEKLRLQRVVLVGQGEGACLASKLSQRMHHRVHGIWAIDAWPAAPLPANYQQWCKAAAKKPHWNVANGWIQAGMLVPHPGDAEQRAANAPFVQTGHRAALKAWPQVMQQLSEMAEEGAIHPHARPCRMLVSQSETHPLWSAEQVKTAWQQVIADSKLGAMDWSLTPVSPLFPQQAALSVGLAMEYFLPL